MRAISTNFNKMFWYNSAVSAQLFPRGIPLTKRLFDLVLTLPGLIIISPFLLLIAGLVWLTHGRPILFGQLRPGYKGGLFKVYKFRSMTNAKDAAGNLFPDEKRVTAFGNFQ